MFGWQESLGATENNRSVIATKIPKKETATSKSVL